MRSSFPLWLALAPLLLGCADLLGIHDVTRDPGLGGGGGGSGDGGGSSDGGGGSGGGGGSTEERPPATPVPRLPLQDAAVGSMHVPDTRRPTFVWEPSESTAEGSIEYTIELSEDPSFAVLLATETTTATRWQPAADLEGSAAPPVGSRVYWRVRACAGDACSAPSAVRRINVGRGHRDLDGDAFDDILVGATGYAVPGFIPCGAAYVFRGGEGEGDGFDAASDGLLLGVSMSGTPIEAAGFGSTAATADVNGDGFADAVVAATAFGDNKGFVRVVFGSSTDPGTWPPGQDLSGSLPGDDRRFGEALASGDMNGDGYADVVVGAPGQGPTLATDPGSAYVFPGGPEGLDRDASVMFTGVQSSSAFGASVASADFNGDGFSDVAVGAPGSQRVHVYFGSAGALDTVPDGVLVGEGELGLALDAGDVNGDGFADLLVGEPVSSMAFLFLGGPGAEFDATADLELHGEGPSDRFGQTVSSSGDLDGDGFAEMLVGAPEVGASGKMYVFRGGESLDAEPDAAMTPLRAGAVETKISRPGDFNRDGLGDVVVVFGDGRNIRREVLVFLGGNLADSSQAALEGAGAASDERFGSAVSP
ncbi:FG-GAP-like repeat-containing protein [Sorangium sp. So ce406]|uniref:FG-GAP-like repeat-containing protein n=1 Tax=Sorangium sp. So ce406 TaxID=3133311 RepID=UPI003F5B0BB5